MTQTYEEPGTALSVTETRPLTAATGVMPIVTPEEAAAQMAAYTALVEAVIRDEDYQTFKERGKEKRFKKKSAVKKLQTYFGFTISIVDSQRDDLGDGHFGFRVKARAVSPNGRSVEALAGCATTEERFDVQRKTERWDKRAERYVPWDEPEAEYEERARKANARAYHDVLSTAETRATNRAAMNLIGAGEVTAEEISRPPRAAAPRAPQVAPEPAVERVPVAELQDQARSLGITDFRAWLVANVATDLATRGLRPAESVEAKRLLDLAQGAVMAAQDAEPERRIQPRTNGRLFAMLSERGMDEKHDHVVWAAEQGVVVTSFSELTEAQGRDLIRKLELIPPHDARDEEDALWDELEQQKRMGLL